MKKLIFFPLLIVFLTCCSLFGQDSYPERILWYDQPAEFFEQALPIGNGRIGATVYGGIINERINLNESSLWSGGPVDAYMNPEAYKHLPEIREALFEENYKKADKLVRQLQGKFSESYLPLGDMYMDFKHSKDAINYRRSLDIRTGITTVTYKVNNTFYKREIFVSYPDQIMVIHMSAEGKDKLNFSLSFDSQLKFTTQVDNNNLVMQGKAPVHAEPSYRRGVREPIRYDEEKGMRFETLARILMNKGTLSQNKNNLTVENSDEVTIIVSIATSYNGIDKEPGTEGVDQSAKARKYLDLAINKEYEELKRTHQDDFSSLFNRVTLDLGLNPVPELPTDQRLVRYTDGKKDTNLEALYFQFGRYLMISASRPGGIPSNLQGIWNPHVRPPWSSNFTSNINAEMNYWPAEVTNLSELHKPLLDFIGRLSKTGEITAKTFYGCEGWCCSHNTDLWAMTNPVGDFGEGDPVWSNWSMAGPWYSTHLWEHFQFNLDTTFLKDHAYPIMKGAARFCLDFLVENPEGYLVTAPSTSPENIYITDKGYRGATLYGSTADLAMIREHLNNTLEACEVLAEDEVFQSEIKKTLEKLYPYQVGNKGNLQEWYYDWDDADPAHRHVSHLFGLYPGKNISMLATPKLAAACRTSLELRGDGGTGWSKAWKINLWARLLDGDHAYKMLQTHLHYSDPSPEVNYRGGGTYPNLWDAHPPFQIDGNFGGTAGIAEMLLQSHNGEVHLLPALPEAWKEGKIKGLRARGGYTVDIEWEDGKLKTAMILPDFNGTVIVRYKDRVSTHQVVAGKGFEIK